jgi:RNA polymerase sigma factor (TIGR02999 family)
LTRASNSHLVELLGAAQAGSKEARAKLVSKLLAELRELASAPVKRQRGAHGVPPNDLVLEAVQRMMQADDVQSSPHRRFLYPAAAAAMRLLLVEHARSRRPARRGESKPRHLLDAVLAHFAAQNIDMLALDVALTELEVLHPRAAQVVMLRYFAGSTLQETAERLGIPQGTAERDDSFAVAWLHRRLSAPEE